MSSASAGRGDFDATRTLTAACAIVAGSVGTAEAQQTPASLPAVTVDAPVSRPRAAPPKPSTAQLKARTAIRRKAREARTQSAPVSGPAAAPSGLPTFAQGGAAADANPYADPAAPYKADRLSSNKFTEPLLNTPKTVTVLTKEVLEDKKATTLREIGRTTAGVTLGSGEGGNAFGDRFFIRGFDARGDIFVDGVRDPGVSVRENFFTEQVEILRGPASSFAGRGTTGGAINIVTKKAGDVNFTNIETTLGSDQTKRVTVDVNRAISPIWDVRVNGLFQDASVAGRDFTTDNRNGIAGAVTFKGIDNLTVTADYAHTYLSGLPDFGVPYDPVTHRPVTEGVNPRNTYYGILNRDFTKTTQNIGTINGEYKVNDWLTLSNKARQGYSVLNYVGTIPENPSATGLTAPFSSTAANFTGFTQLNAQSRFETSAVLADQTEAIAKFETGPVKHTVVFGTEFSGERISLNSYTGLTSELATGNAPSPGAPITTVVNPLNYIPSLGTPALGGNPQIYHVDTKSVYLMDTANWNDTLILNGGLRYDNYNITSQNNTASVSATSDLVNYNVGLVYKPIPIGSVYAAFATAADPIGDELDANASAYGGLSPTQPAGQIFGPQRSQAVEVGTKWELFDRHLLATAAAFQTTVENARETVPTGTPASTGLVVGSVAAGAAYKVQGLDFEVAGKITEKWSVIGGVVLMKSDITKSVVPHNVGLQLANIAHQSFNLLSKYEFTSWFELGAQASYASQIEGGSLLAANGGVAYGVAPSPTILPSHWRFDTFAETKIGPYTTLKLYVQNIFNRTYYDSIYQSGVPFIAVAPGRSVSLIATAKF
ncbi:TonB-dependent receptor [Beijerinckia sp. L45]|uniref:TonB-dependent receptor n=1 Tax=Beijerinckia sp. L45 TaxID=1641855 RepID=UPI0034CDA414